MIELQTDTDLFGTEISRGSTIDRAMLAAGLYANLKDISLQGLAELLTNPFEAVIDYVNLCAGEKTGQRISLLFNPHRLDTQTKQRSVLTALKDFRFCDGLARVAILKKGTTQDILYASIGMGVNHTSYIQEFPPHVARDLALEYSLSKSSKVLDPCAGWGGRMIGFSTIVDSYTCCEPSTRTAAGLRKLHDWLRVFRSSFTATIYEAPFEDVELPPQSFDFALTSPPYYDTERYADEPTNSFKRYSTFEAWCTGFYAPLIHRTMAALKPDAAFVLNIGSRVYPLNERLHQIIRDRYIVEKQKGKLSASNGLGKDGEGETFYEIRNPVGVVYVASAPELLSEEQPSSAIDALTTKPDAVFSTPSHPSALDFAFKPVQSEQCALTGQAFSPQLFAIQLTARGHRLLTRDGKFFVSDASRLTAADREMIKQHREQLIVLAELWLSDSTMTAVASGQVDIPDGQGNANRAQVDDDAGGGIKPSASPVSFFDDRHPTQTLAQFLGSESPRINTNYVPDEPPDLTGIDEVVLNFATNGLDWAAGDHPIGVTVSTLDGQLTRFLPFAFAGGNLDESAVKRWAREQLRGKKITNAKTKFDVHFARVWGVDLEAQGCTFSDIQHTAALLDDHRKRFALDALAADYFPGEQFAARVDETRHHEHHAAEVDARERTTAHLVGRLRTAIYPEIDKQELRAVQDLEDAVIPTVVEMEKNGAPIDMMLLEQYGRECAAAHDALMWEISKECGFAFEHTATGWKRLIESLRLPMPDSFSESVLNEVDHPLIRKGQRASQYASLNSKIFKAYPEHIVDGILRYNINQLASDEGGTVSGRFSIGLVQQVPNEENHTATFGDALFPRRLFIPGSGDYLEGDAAQIEFRLLVHYSENAELLQAYRDDPEMSFHKTMQEMLKVYKPNMLYAHTKNYNFAAQYGARSIKLASMMGFITEREGDEIRAAKRWNDPRLTLIHEIEAAYRSAHPEASALLDRAAHLAKPKCDEYCKRSDALHRQYPHRGYVKTLLGRRSRFPTNYKTYIGLNRVLQGTGADIMKQKLVELHREKKHTGLLMRLTVHDAVCGDAQEPKTVAKVDEILNRQSFLLKVPILWSVGAGRNWAECK